MYGHYLLQKTLVLVKENKQFLHLIKSTRVLELTFKKASECTFSSL